MKLNKRAPITSNYHLRDYLKRSTRADRQNASYVCPPSDLFLGCKDIKLQTISSITTTTTTVTTTTITSTTSVTKTTIIDEGIVSF